MISRHIDEAKRAGLYVVEGRGAAQTPKDDRDEGATRTARVARACRRSCRLNIFEGVRQIFLLSRNDARRVIEMEEDWR